jgi:hypothetical protein
MKLIITILFGMLCLPISTVGQFEEADPYSVKLVQAALRTRSGGLTIAKVQTHLARMGDAASIALLKIFNEAELEDPHIVEVFLPIIRDSFSQPQLISVDIDKKPMITLFLLKQLKRNIADAQTQGDIDETIKFVHEKTTSQTPRSQP